MKKSAIFTVEDVLRLYGLTKEAALKLLEAGAFKGAERGELGEWFIPTKALVHYETLLDSEGIARLKAQKALDGYTVVDLRRMYGFSKQRAGQLIRHGRFPGATKKGHDWIIPSEAIEVYEASLKKPRGKGVVRGEKPQSQPRRRK